MKSRKEQNAKEVDYAVSCGSDDIYPPWWLCREGLELSSYESYVTGMALASALARGDIQVAYIRLVPAINAYANARVPIKVEMADRMALIHNGRIQQVSRPQDMVFSPWSETVSDFVGMPNILGCDYSRVLEQGLIEISCRGMSMFLPYEVW